MSTAHLFALLAAFVGGNLYGDLPRYRFGITLLVGSVISTSRFRLLFLTALACGVVNAMGRSSIPLADERPLAPIKALVLDRAQTGNGVVSTLQLADGHRVTAWFPGTAAPLPAHRVRIQGELVPFDEARNPGARAPRDTARERGLFAEVIHARVTEDEGVPAGDPAAILPRVRAWARARLDQNLDPIAAALTAGVLLGEQDGLPAELRAAFSSTGTAHVLVTAGLHLAVIGGLLFGICRRLRFGRFETAFAISPCLVLYAALAGGHLPVVRAAASAIAVLFARACGTKLAGARALIAALFFACILMPEAPAHIGFWLSACCVGAIVVFRKPIAARLKFLPAWIREPAAVTLAAQLGTWPLIAAAFHFASLITPPANLLVIPIISLELTTGLLLLFLAAVRRVRDVDFPTTKFAHEFAATQPGHPLATAFHRIHADLILALLNRSIDAALRVTSTTCALLAHLAVAVVRWCAALPHGVWNVPDPPPLALALYYLLLGLAALIAYRRDTAEILLARLPWRWQSSSVRMGCIALAQVVMLVACVREPANETLRLTMLDVGQGDGMVLETPHRHVIVIDTGGRLELHAAHLADSPAERAGAAVLLPFLAHEGIRRVDLLVLTHPHGDHVGGAAPLLAAMPVGEIFDSGQDYGGRAYRDAMQIARAQHVPIHLARRGEIYQTDDGIRISVLAPFRRSLAPPATAVNEGSIVLRLGYQNWNALFMGDAGLVTEARLLAAHDRLQSDLLKVGHHGSNSATSPAFLRAVNPRLALISDGRHNLFHHPAPSTLAVLRAGNVPVLRTDQCGAIIVTPATVRTMLNCQAP